jgi:serine/threonine protein kinase
MLDIGEFAIPGYRLVSKLGRGTFGEVWRAAGLGLKQANAKRF